ncbi:uncharacterized protein LOC135193590 [Vanessa tameamea]|uniref:Uncharacterized protein LOC135193590 n=1 Tax=Vanessa tameamea TaxID=334116 RepID=A0ABM4AN84_VANTA
MIVATETWLDDTVADGELFTDKYTIYRRDRQSTSSQRKTGGGVLFAVSKSIESRRIEHLESNGEDLWISVKVSENGVSTNILFCAVYIPPPISLESLNLILDNISVVMQSNPGKVVVLGDFNLGFLNWQLDETEDLLKPDHTDNILGFPFADFLSLNSLTQYNKIKNHIQRILDLVMNNFNNLTVIEACQLLSNVDPHHPALEISLRINADKFLYNKIFATYLFRKADYDAVNRCLGEFDWYSELGSCGNVDAMVEKLYNILYAIIDSHVPKIKPKAFKYPVWFTSSLIKLINEKEKVRKLCKRYKNPRDILELARSRRRVENLLELSYSRYISGVEDSIFRDPLKFWRFVKKRRGAKSEVPSEMSLDNTTAHSGQAICNLFVQNFASSYSSLQPCVDFVDESPDFYSQMSLAHVTLNERTILKALRSINPSKSAGPDGIPPLFFRKTYFNFSYEVEGS